MRSSSSIAFLVVALVGAGCGARDTEVDGIPGPGARAPTPAPSPVTVNTPIGEDKGGTAGINSVGRPAGSAGGNTGPTTIGDSQEQPIRSAPRPSETK